MDTKFGAIVQNFGNNPLFNSSNRVARILYRLSAYRRLSWHILRRGVPAREILRTQFPFIEPNPRAPTLVSVEFTNYCDLRCVYCTCPLGLRPHGFMQRATFERLLDGIKQLGVRRVNVVGDGESTMHPEFTSLIRELCRSVPYVLVLTNGQWKRPKDIINAMLEARVSVVEVSVDGGDEGYEKSRLGGHFERLLENLTLLSTSKRKLRSRTMTYICLMLRPSECVVERELMAFWNNYADVVMPQYLLERRHLAFKKDVYMRQEAPSINRPLTSPRTTTTLEHVILRSQAFTLFFHFHVLSSGELSRQLI
jgi:uncharacterized Fe-S cluster-containing radical SAM superfamily protein